MTDRKFANSWMTISLAAMSSSIYTRYTRGQSTNRL